MHIRLIGNALERNSVLRPLVALGGILVLTLLGMFNQPSNPSAWLDEGFVMQGSINLLRFGKYAMRSVEGFRILDQPLIANGPGIVIPITASYALLGIGLWQARLVAALFMTLTGIVFFAVVKRMYGTWAAVISMFFLLALPKEGFLFLGRQILGIVPALGYFLAGYLLWLVSLEKRSWQYALGAGLLFGLCMVTKGQYYLLVPVLLIVAVADHIYYKQIGIRNLAIVLSGAFVCLLIWGFVQVILVGWGNMPEHLNAIRASSQVTVFAFRPMRIPGNLWYLVTSGIIIIVAPGLSYVAWACRKPNMESCRQLPLIIFAIVWLFWFVFVSVGWHRYALEIYVIGALFWGRTVLRAIFFLQSRMDDLRGRHGTILALRGAGILAVAVFFLFGIWGAGSQVSTVFAGPDDTPEKFAQYIQAKVRSESLIESWEWEIDAMTNLKYHHPTNDWVDKMTAVLQFHDGLKDYYDPFAYRPDYLIDGPFSKWTGLYTQSLRDCCSLVVRIGPYDLYKVEAYKSR